MINSSLSAVIIGEGSSDDALEQPIRWLFKHVGLSRSVDILSCQHSFPSGYSLAEKISKVVSDCKPNFIFIHRDGDSAGFEQRLTEITTACEDSSYTSGIPVIPVKMMEAWLLIDENAIRMASGNPKSRVSLNLPTIRQLEGIADPKSLLFDKIRLATELTGRRWKKFKLSQARRRTAEEICDYSPLLSINSFSKLKDEIEMLKSKIDDSENIQV